MFEIWIDDVTVHTEVAPTINNLTVVPGTYYLVASSSSNEFTVEINADELSCPEMAYNPYPTDAATEVSPNNVTLSWNLGERTTQFRIMFGTTYYCEETLVDWTSNLTEHYTLLGLNNNTNYFWRIDERNDGCSEGVIGQVWGFTTHLNVPTLYGDNYTYVGNDCYLNWSTPSSRDLLSYNLYQDDVLIANTTENSYTISNLGYNTSSGYRFNVTAVYDEGESHYSNNCIVYVSGYGIVEGHVYEQDGITPIAYATIEINGYDEFEYQNGQGRQGTGGSHH